MPYPEPQHRQRESAPPPSQFDPLSTFQMSAVQSRAPGRYEETGKRAAMRAAQRGRADIIIIGNGIAGCVAAIEARRHDPQAEIVMVTEQNHPTINTPALKQFGAGHLELDQLLAYPPGTERRLRIGVMHQRVDHLDTAARQVRLHSGLTITYERLLLATGSRPVGFDALPGGDFDGVVTLHNLAQYLDLRRRLPSVSSALVIGGGYHAAETALLLARARVRVCWLIRGRGMLSGQLDARASELLLREVRRQGVDVRLDTEVAGVVGRLGVATGVLTTTGEFIPGALIVAATGVRPAVELAHDTELAMQLRNGIRVDPHLQTQVPGVYAAGAVASILSPQTGAREPRAQWYFAFRQGRLAGAALAGARIPEAAETAAMGAFWHATPLGRHDIVSAGAPMLDTRGRMDVEVLCNNAPGYHRRLVIRDDRLVGYLAVGGHTPSGLAIKRLIDEGVTITSARRTLLSEDFDVQAFLTKHQRAYLVAASSPASRTAHVSGSAEGQQRMRSYRRLA